MSTQEPRTEWTLPDPDEEEPRTAREEHEAALAKVLGWEVVLSESMQGELAAIEAEAAALAIDRALEAVKGLPVIDGLPGSMFADGPVNGDAVRLTAVIEKLEGLR